MNEEPKKMFKSTEQRINEIEKIAFVYGKVTNEASKRYKDTIEEKEFIFDFKKERDLLLEKDEKKEKMIIKDF